jgi:hypothetical protein
VEEGAYSGGGVGADRDAGPGGDLHPNFLVAADGLVGEEGECVSGEVGVAGIGGGGVALLVQPARVRCAACVEGCPPGLLGLFGQHREQAAAGLLGIGRVP